MLFAPCVLGSVYLRRGLAGLHPRVTGSVTVSSFEGPMTSLSILIGAEAERSF